MINIEKLVLSTMKRLSLRVLSLKAYIYQSIIHPLSECSYKQCQRTLYNLSNNIKLEYNLSPNHPPTCVTYPAPYTQISRVFRYPLILLPTLYSVEEDMLTSTHCRSTILFL